jgi:signal transduction histidine kinase
MHDGARPLAGRWLTRLRDLLPQAAEDIFPSDDYLDHVPLLIGEIAEYLGDPEAHPLADNSKVFSKARELGELRFSQDASVHQLLREYRLLGLELGAFVREIVGEASADGSPPPVFDAANVMIRLNEAVSVLLETTVDTFVGRYTERIDNQRMRLESFNRMVSHELRQPMDGIQAAIALLDASSPADDAQRRRAVETAARNLRRLADLTRMLGALASSDTGSPQRQDVDIAKLGREVARQLADVAAERQVAIRNRLPSRTISIDVSRLELTLINLVSNAIKYSDPGKDDRFVALELAPESPDGEWNLIVRDNGIGIPEADRRRVFERFYRGHAGGTGTGPDGVGLGLAIASECVKAMGGSIELDSEEGAGSTFVISLKPADGGGRDRPRR